LILSFKRDCLFSLAIDKTGKPAHYREKFVVATKNSEGTRKQKRKRYERDHEREEIERSQRTRKKQEKMYLLAGGAVVRVEIPKEMIINKIMSLE
jgi:hypothetical protein